MVTENGQSDGNTSFLRAARNGQLDKVLEHLKSNIDINTSNANGLNALHLASKDGHVDIVEELLKRGAVVDAATKKGNTALHIASLAGQEEVVKLLVLHGASVNVQSQNGFTPLYMAAQENHDNVVKYLLANGANQSLSTEDGFTPLAVAMQQGHDKVVTVLLENDTRGKIRLPALHIAAKKDDVKAAKLLLENEHNPDVTSKSGFTPLHIASHYGNQQIANLLVQKGADVNYSAKHNITPLHVAAKWGKANMVALLLEHGATIEAKTRDGLTPLHCAARSGHEQVVDMLLEKGAPISSKTKNGLAPLHMAAQGDHVDAARILLYHRAPVDEVTVDYLTALHVAAHCGHARVAKLLLDRQADANARALNGFTPLHIACKKNRIKVVELLLKHGASIGATTESGLTPLHVASFMGGMNIVIYLLQHDANPDVPTVRGETPLHLAARANQTDIIRILLRNGAQVDARAREQQTPLHIASRLGNVDIVMLLLQHGAKVDNTTKDMYTALHIAAKEGRDEVAAVLLDNGASLDATTKKGFTPLHLAAKYGNLKVAKLLLQKEAPVDAQGKNGVTPLHVASHYDHQNVALLLLDKGASPHAIAKNGHTPLHIAGRKNQMDIANTLLEYGAQPNAESKAGFTPLHLSAQEGHGEMSALLLEHKADANHEAKNGLTPLHLCAQEDRVPVAEVLVKNGAEVNAPTKGGYTPLHIASHYGQTNMVRFLLQNGADIESTTSLKYTPLHQAAQQGHANIVNILLEQNADPNAVTTAGQTPLNIAQKLGYITVIETLKVVTTVTNITTTTTTNIEEKYRVQAPELMHETFMSDSEEEGEDTVLGDQAYRYLTADEMKSLGDDSLPIDVTRDERIDSNRMVSSGDSNMLPPQHIEDSLSPEHVTQNYTEYIKKYASDNVDIARHPINIGFLVSFLVDARGGAMRGCRHSGVRVIVPPRCAPSPTRITCRYVRPQRTPHPPPLMEGEALASRVLELGPVGAKFLGPVIIEVPHFAALRGKEREIVILRSDNGESWKEHTVDAAEEVLNEVLHDSFEAEDLNQMEDISSGRITRIVSQDFPQYFAVVSRVRQEVHAIGPEGGMVSSTVVPQVQAVFPEGALTKKIKVGLQAQPIDPELTAKLLGHSVAVSPVVTVEPRRRKFHKAITLSMPAPRAHSQGMINQYSGSAPTLRLLCSITGGTTRAQWEDVTGSTPLTFVNDCVSFTTTVSARFWLMDCRNISDATKMATELYKEAIHVPFMAKFVVFAKRVDPLEARLRVFCMTDDKEDKTLEHQEHFTEVAKSRDVEVLEGKQQYVEFAGNLVPITKSGEQLSFSFRAFRENRLPFSVRVKDQHAEAVSRCLFMKEAKVPKGEQPQQPICILNIVLPDDIVTDTISLTDIDKKSTLLSENFDYYRPDPRLADMSNLLGEHWVPLANQLGLTTSEINVIKSEYPDSVAKQAQSMLRMWLSQSGNKAKTNTLENALRRIGREDIIPQCLNVDHSGQTITRIKQHEEIGKYRLKKEKDVDSLDDVVNEDVALRIISDKQESKKKLESYDKYSAEEKVVEKSEEEEEEEAFEKPVAERREKIEKRLSSDRTIPASSQRKEIVQEITTIKQQSLVEDKIAEVQQKAKTTEEYTKTTSTKTVVTEYDIQIAPTKTVSRTVEIKTTLPSDSKVSVTDEVRSSRQDVSHKTADDVELLEGVTQSLEKGKVVSKLITEEDPKSPMFSKTPPPSPADFSIRGEKVSTVNEWEAEKPHGLESVSSALGKDAAQKESSCDQLTPAETNQLPQPKPRTAKTPETHPQIIREDEEKPLSPVRDDLLDDVPETYSDKKKFWENVSQQSTHKRMSLQETTSERETTVSKRISVHEFAVPPVPKPRTTLQTSQSMETSSVAIDKEDHKPIMVKDRTVSFESSASESSGLVQTDLTRITESDTSQHEEVAVTEYQASFGAPATKISPKERFRVEFQKTESIDNTGYISDSEDVEHYISDSEIEDRVPQIRDRMMSVFVPSVSSVRKSLYERSASLPTEDLYEVSARSIKARKDYYEEQIRKEMIEEQLTSEIEEEEPSPERKNLTTSSGEDEHTDADARSIGDDVDEISEEPLKSDEIFKPTKGREQASSVEIEGKKTSVKDLAKGYEKQLGNVVAGHRIGQLATETKGFVLDKQKIDENKFKEQDIGDSTDLVKPDEAHKLDDQSPISTFPQLETHKEIEIDDQHKQFESQRSVSSDKSAETVGTRDGSHSTKPDSMEVLVDKSEIEDTEKLAELDQDIEGKSMESFETEQVMNIGDDMIPDITVTLSGIQKRMSEESDEYAVKDIEEKEVTTEDSVKLPQENTDDVIWEVSVESPSGVEFDETVEDIDPKIQGESIKQYLIEEKSRETILEHTDPRPVFTGREEKISTLETKGISEQDDCVEHVLEKSESIIKTSISQNKTIAHSEDSKCVSFKGEESSTELFEQGKQEEISVIAKVSQPIQNISEGILISEMDSKEVEEEAKSQTSEEITRTAIKQELSTSEHSEEITSNISTDETQTNKMDLKKDVHVLEGSKHITESFITQEKSFIEQSDYSFVAIEKQEVSPEEMSMRNEQNNYAASVASTNIRDSTAPLEISTLEKTETVKSEIAKDGSKQDFMQAMKQQDELSELLEAKLKQQSLDTPSQEQLSAEMSEEHHSSLLTVEKDDDFSSSVKDESELGSEIHQDHSVSEESERIKSESHNEIERIILDSLHQQRVHPEEAKRIASSLLEEIEAEIQKREIHQEDYFNRSAQPIERTQVSEFLQKLAESKGLDDREVELVQSVLARRQRGLARLTRGDTTSSMEITDEDLKYSGAELDYSHVLEQQMDQLEAEKISDIHLDYNNFEEQAKRFQDKSGFVDKIDEEHSEETESSQDYESYENAHTKSIKRDVLMKSSDAVKGEKMVSEVKEIVFENNKFIADTKKTEHDELKTYMGASLEEKTHEKTDITDKIVSKVGTVKALTDHSSDTSTEKATLVDENVVMDQLKMEKLDENSSTIAATFKAETKSSELTDKTLKETSSRTDKAYDEISKEKQEMSKTECTKIQKQEDGTEVETKFAVDKTHTVTSTMVTQKDHVHEETTSVASTVICSSEDIEKLISHSSPESVVITSHEIVQRTSSSESKSSTEAKSPEDTSSSRKDDKVSPRLPEVIFRRARSDADTSSSSSNLKPDRKSGIDFETYSSSGESHYHSFEMDSGKSRPCSSDVEGLVAAGSSEYESALTSQEYSARSHMTTTEYRTAVSSISSKGSMKSLDSESSGNLASVEVSEHSETLVPSSSDLEDILDSVEQQLLDDAEQSMEWTGHAPALRQNTEVSDSEILSYQGIDGSMDISEEESVDIKTIDIQSKMKRSQEMTFQPEPRTLVPDSPQSEDKLGTSLDEGSILSVSVSSTSSAGAQVTVVEQSRADSERLECSMTMSGASEHFSLDDIENMPRGSKESLVITPVAQTSDISTSIGHIHPDLPVAYVTLQTATVQENGILSVSTQVTSETQSPIEEVPPLKSDEPKKKGHRRTDSSFTSSMISLSTRAEVERKIHSDLTESDKYTTKLSFKETSYDEKKDVDECEKEESCDTEADQGLRRDYREGRYQDTESDNEQDNLDTSRPQSQFSKSDSERPTSIAFSDDRPDSELADLIVKSSDVTEITDPLERPTSPEPESESHSHIIETTRRSITSFSDIYPTKDVLDKRDSHGKSSSTSSEKSSFEEAEADAAFNMVPHISPAHKIKQICPILEDEDAEKHELETRERAQKEFEERRLQMMKDISPGFVPDIKITQHMAPLVDDSFTYPDLELEAKEREPASASETPQTPASVSSKSSEETDQGREYILDGSVSTILEEPEIEKTLTESKSEAASVVEKTLKEIPDRETDSPSSDSFEMLEKPDLIDDFVVIEEIGKEAEETDAEGKSMHIEHTTRKKEIHDQEVEHYLAHSAPTPLTKIKYYPDGTSSSEELGFDFEDSPPQADQRNAGVSTKAGTEVYGSEYDREIEANRTWIEQQLQGNQASYGYDMEFERGPLEDIKEEDDFAASSYGSQRDSGGSLKESYSSTPEYDVLAGRRYFTRSGEHDDVSMSSLQEFESLEKAMSLEMRKFHTGSQDSSSNGSFKSRYFSGKSGQGDDVSGSSLKEFEGLEKACIAAHTIEIKVKEEEALLANIEEGQESLASESESCGTMSGTEKKVVTDTDDEEDYEKRMFEIDEIIKQAQSNVERFIDLKEAEKTESLGRGDSIEEVSRVPDLDLDAPLARSTVKVQWKGSDDVMVTSTDSLDLAQEKPSRHDSTDSLDQKTGGDIMTASTDSIEFQAQKSAKDDNIMTDSMEIRGDEKSYLISSDSLDLLCAESSGTNLIRSDSIDEDGSRIGVQDHSSSSTGKDFSSSCKEEDAEQDHLSDILDITSSTATHATYQYDTDSVFSGSFASDGSNTMVSSTNSVDQAKQTRGGVDVAAAVRKVWFDEEISGRRTTDYVDDSKPYVTEIIEPCDDEGYTHTIHRRVELPPEVRRVTFTGADAEDRLQQFIRDFNEGEETQETEEIDESGNVHIKKVVQRRFVVKNDGSHQPMSGPEIEEYFRQLNQPEIVQGQGVIAKSMTEGRGVITKTVIDGEGSKTTTTQQFDIPINPLTRTTQGEEEAASSRAPRDSSATSARPRRRQLRYEISVEDQTEVDPREHDWRFNLPKHAEGEEGNEKDEPGYERNVTDQHQLSEEMKALLKELEKESKQ